MNQDRELPYNARGMDFENVSWEVRPDGKVHLFAKSQGGFHWTLHPGTSTGVLDLHETSVNPDGAKLHKTLLMIRPEDFNRLANEIGPVLISGLMQQFRPLSLRWVQRRKITIIRDPTSTDAELAAITYKNKRKRLQFSMERLQDALETASYANGLLQMADGSFRLMAIRRWGTRWIGVGLKVTDGTGAVHLLWARPEDLVGWGEQTQEVLKEAAAKYLVPEQDYTKYLSRF